ncbi:acyl-CoA thioesterase/bile acid-CoA:amino acid N-acyltransferase family protein [Clostridium felsineum]|uniref:Uncharacterized protein n=1 Tax=Clostridium felsineum TaxID=36839 RepID=A0A1S8LHA7_9CLOT|nr:acyl-CoA thioesterase/bile acid-CoA:amino acid N-acyltransferase family protein [Clostridium felsineum]URZ03131.1 hypothetical protein CLAUR_031770 [Clostridium felsineum]URZ08524.1 hypothetical protein CLROS_039060 [Clostridium felsineum]URZ13555.1 hypothetical protein CROST_043210 [Clostridium felsineum]
MKNINIIIEPKCSMIDEKVSIIINGLYPFQEVKIKAYSLDYYRLGVKNNNPNNWKWVKKSCFSSFAVFKADLNGNVNLSLQAPLKGSYTGVDVMGLFWSMKSHYTEDYNLGKDLSSSPFLSSMNVIFEVEVNEKRIASSTCKKLFIDSDVHCEYVTENKLVGKYFSKKNSKIKNGIIVLSGSEGGIHNASQIAALLASHGHPALALAYFGMDNLPDTLKEIQLEYFEKAIDWIIQKGDINPNKLIVFGRSRGGELALLLGSTFKKIASVITVSGSPISFKTKTQKFSSWQYKNKDIPQLNLKINILSFLLNAFVSKIKRKDINFSKIYDSNIKNFDKIKDYIMPIENINGPMLMVSGYSDSVWPSTKLCQLGMHRLNLKKFDFNHILLNYKAGHHMYFPYQPIYFSNTPNEDMAHSNQESWCKILEFLSAI